MVSYDVLKSVTGQKSVLLKIWTVPLITWPQKVGQKELSVITFLNTFNVLAFHKYFRFENTDLGYT